jgi:hypothetical protein
MKLRSLISAGISLAASGLLTLAAITYTPAQNPSPITVAWNYPYPLGTATSFNLYTSSTLTNPFNTWTLLTNFPGTSTDGTNLWVTTNGTFNVNPGVAAFFFLTASNFWESVPSNVTTQLTTPPMPPGLNLHR